MAPLDTEEQNSQDQAAVDDQQSAPGASGTEPGKPSSKRAAKANNVNDQSSAAAPQDNDGKVNSFCEHLLNCDWFEKREDIDNDYLSILEQAASLETFKNIDGGFEFKVLFDDDGKSRERTIQWQLLPPTRDKAEREFISGRSRGFCQQDAKAIVALAAVRGWDSINVHGSQKQKDMLWLEAMKLELKVNGHTPGPEALQAWEEYKANASPAGVTSTQEEPSVTADNTGRGTPPPAEGNDAKPQPTPAQQAQPDAQATSSQQDAGNDSSVRSSVRGGLSGEYNPAASDSRQGAQSAPATSSQPASQFLGEPKSNSANNNPTGDASRQVGKHRKGPAHRARKLG